MTCVCMAGFVVEQRTQKFCFVMDMERREWKVVDTYCRSFRVPFFSSIAGFGASFETALPKFWLTMLKVPILLVRGWSQ